MSKRMDEKQCDASLEDHLDQLRFAMNAVGIGGACVETYQSLLIVAEALRLVHCFPTYDPAVEADKMVQRILAVRAKMEAAGEIEPLTRN